MLDIRPAAARGYADFGWLNSRHSFSFGSYYDPEHVSFSDLVVINEDRVEPGFGFDPHSHRDMEIFSYVLEGALAHKDSMGHGASIQPGDVQLMSAGTGVQHSEYNASTQTPVHFLQIWIAPARQQLAPRYQQQHFSAAHKRGRWCLIISPQGEDGSLTIQQDARVYAACLDGTESLQHQVEPSRYAYIHVARGSLVVNGQRVSAGDGIKVREPGTLDFGEGQAAEILLFDLRAHGAPVRG